MGVRYFFISLVKLKIESKMAKARNSNTIHLGPVKGKRRQIMVTVSAGVHEGQEIKYSVKHDKIIFRSADLDDRHTVKPQPRINNGAITIYTFEICVGDEDWVFGDYLIDEDETNEDQIVFYKEDLIAV